MRRLVKIRIVQQNKCAGANNYLLGRDGAARSNRFSAEFIACCVIYGTESSGAHGQGDQMRGEGLRASGVAGELKSPSAALSRLSRHPGARQACLHRRHVCADDDDDAAYRFFRIQASGAKGKRTSRWRKDVNNTARRRRRLCPARLEKRGRERERERETYTYTHTFVNRENVDDSMTHEERYGSRNIGRRRRQRFRAARS